MTRNLALYLLFAAVSADQLILQQPHITPPKNSHFRDILWGDLNFIHTTDTHGWYAGHLNQKQYSADWGDFISFTSHMHRLADNKGADLLLIDTGDKYDGNGLSDATDPAGLISNKVFSQQDYDLITLGNHELYDEAKSIQEFQVNVKRYGEHYISSNVEYLNSCNDWVPFGNQYRYFTTKNQKKRILALSFLFDFRRYNSKVRVTPLLQSIEESWFEELTTKYTEADIDVLVIFGHLPVSDIENREISKLHTRLRDIYPQTIIQYFGGHSHIRDFVQFDYQSTGLQSGRYSETVGWLSFNHTNDGTSFHRRYIDFNRESFQHHAQVDTLETSEGAELTKFIYEQRLALNLTYSYGYVPESYFISQYPLGHKNNIYHFLNTTILPTLHQDTSGHRVILINTGSVRYDLYKGNFTKDTEFIVSPFKNNWNYITLPKELALEITPFLNDQDYILSTPETLSSFRGYCPFIDDRDLKKGLTTRDDYGCNGDDVLHNSVHYYRSPNIIQTYQEVEHSSNHDNLIDLVFYDFLKPNVIYALNELDINRTYSNKDFHLYKGESVGKLLRNYVKNNWS